jgi:RND family efflux transporter MFP subunit
MTGERRLNLSPGAAAAAVISVLLIGAAGTYLVMRGGSSLEGPRTAAGESAATGGRPAPSGPASAPPSAPGEGASAPLPDVVVTLTKEAADRAGIALSRVSAQSLGDTIRLPGIVEPNAYRQVAVTPLVGGRIVSVKVQLGDRVRRGQAVAQVYSPDLAEARTRYVAARAMLDAHDRELQRTQKLVEIGAASRQELERIHAEHAAQTAQVESAESRLRLLGAAAEQTPPGKGDSSATIDVPAPIDGVVTERVANAGLNVDATTRLLSIVDLSSVWIIGDVYERDLHRVAEGARATVTTRAYPDLSLDGRVSYIDPQLSAGTRTAKVRVEVANPRGELRLGMYTDVTVASASHTPVLSVPKGAVQTVGGRQVVYLPVHDEAAKFVEREVTLGRSSGEAIEVVSGVAAEDSVVSTGSFFLRAEVDRLGLRPRAAEVPSASTAADPAGQKEVQTAKIAVTEKGFEPARVSLRAGVPARLTIVRTTDKTCATEIVFPALKLKRELPLKQPVVIEFTPPRSGEIAFACGMNMLSGVIVAQ